MELKEMIKVMQHYADGGEIELKAKDEDDTKWGLCDSPYFDWYIFEYRIKKPKQKVTIEKWLCSDDQGNFIVIETSDIDACMYIAKKLKLLESYKIEL